jgi:hypothetical protein
LNTPRNSNTATLLPNGKVLIAGGYDYNSGFLATAELYDPTTGAYTPTGSMTTPRLGHTATLLNNGKVLIVGGEVSSSVYTASAELYDPASGTFTATGSMSVVHYAHSATLLNNGKVLIAGGYNPANGYLADAQLYDPVSGTFSSTGSLVVPHYGHTATLLNNGKVLIVAGYNAASGSLAEAELYDPVAQAFSATGSLNTARSYPAATLLNDGTVLYTGGYVYASSPYQLSSAELYNPTTGTFTTTSGNLSTALYGHSSTLLTNGMVLLAGGANNASYSLNQAELYDPSVQTFSVTAGLTTPRVSQQATLLTNGQVLMTGGLTASQVNVPNGELYVPPSVNLTNLVSIAVAPANPTLMTGASQKFTATGTFSNSSTQTLASVVWNSSNQTVASITNDTTNQGTAITLSGGTATITACDGSVCGSTTLSSLFPVVSLSGNSLTFANQNVGTSSSAQTVTLTNTGTGPLTISALGLAGANPGDFIETTSCPVSPSVLAAGANCTINLKFQPTATGTRSASVSIVDNAAGSPQTLALSGTGTLPSITLAPASLAFGNQVINITSAAKTITLTNPGSGTLTISSIQSAGANAAEFTQTNTCGATVAAGGSCTISVKFAPVTAGAKAASITVTDNSSGSPHSVALTGTGILPFTATPSPLAFGNQGVGSTSAAKTVTLTNNSSVAVTISSTVISGANSTDFAKSATTCGASLASKASCTISITFTPSAAAPESATLTITDSAANSPQSVSLTGTGVAQATVAPVTLAFGNQGLSNTSAPKAVTLTNNTSASISLSGNTISGTNASAFAVSGTTCAASLAGHSSCTISVTFTPATTGVMTATLSIADSASNSPQTVNLTGTGLQPVTLSVATMVFGNQGINSTSVAKTVMVTNNNSVALTFASIVVATTVGNSNDFAQSATTCGASIGAHASCAVSVTYTPTIATAEGGTLTLMDSAGNSPQTVGLTGTGVAQFTLSATTLAFGNQAIGTTSGAKSVTITNNTSSAVAFTSLGSPGANFNQSATTCGTSLNGHSSCTISYTFSPATATAYSVTVQITDGASNSPQSLALTGTGLVPVAVTPATLTFAAQTVGTTSAAQVITLKNNLATTLTGISISNANVAEFLQSATTCGTTLNAGASCTISIKFKPSATGTRSGMLSVSDSAVTSPQSVSLTGTGK